MSKTQTTAIDRLGNEQFLLKAQESTRRLWLFSLGAYSLATRTGAEAFQALVREGKAFRPKARRQIKETSAELMSSATDSIDRGEKLVRNRLIEPLNFLVLASKRDVEQLSQRLAQLTAEVRKLGGTKDQPATRKPAAKAAAKAVAASTVSESADSEPTMAAAS
ncbi:phasin family protein [Accumulibacter sp.]|uniref:phasin family protein n=1 Tax=Accumulibacter sp. TaxID=2053492 RepID=UPI001D1BBF58|nr:phasin family protein [Accumulibacter sp.]MCB1965849.1 phasin family protein [Accumulibacter sp.]MCP5229401.1 phasin family protein [Accumulibacter sp.]